MRRVPDDLGITQGVYFLVINLGVGALALGAVAGTLALVSDLPWWSISIMGVGAFMVSTGIIGAAGRWVAGKRASPLTPIIEAGRSLRGRLVQVTDGDAPDEERNRWKRRVEDWVEDAERTIGAVAPHRLGAFKADALYVTVAAKWEPVPLWVAQELVELDVRLERLENLRVSLLTPGHR